VESPPLFLAVPGVLAGWGWQSKMILNEADFWLDAVKNLELIRSRAILELADKLENWSFGQAYRINAVTEGIREKLIRKGVPPEKILFLPNGVDTEMFKPRSPDENLARRLNLSGKKVILYAGNLGYSHGLDTALGAAARLEDHPEVVFVFIGDGSEKAKLQQMARDQALTNTLFLDPAPPEFIVRLFSFSLAGLATVKDLPLFKGVRSAKIFPAMASGVPVLYSGSGEGARLVEEAQAGLTVSPGNPEALAAAVGQLAADPAGARRLGENGRNYVEQNLRWSVLVRSWLEALLGED
jgi:colanic acid biosynthesis glycosyl transferase WcaI